MKVAVAHPSYSGWGGADRVATETARALGAPIVTDNAGSNTPEDVDVIECGLSAKDRFIKASPVPSVSASVRWWSDPDELHEYDVVVCTGLGSAWYRPEPTQRVIHYYHSYERLASDMWRTEATGVKRWVARVMEGIARTQRQRADLTLANSSLTARELRRHMQGVKPDVVFPPVDKHLAMPPASGRGVVYLGRLSEDKGVTGIIEALGPTDVPLHMLGDGPLESLCRHQAAKTGNVTVHGRVNSEKKWKMLAEGDALVLNTQCEHFGIVMAEALASGTPVITNGTGYPGEYIKATREDIGRIFDTQQELREHARQAFDSQIGTTDDCLEAASKFGTERFHREIRDAVDAVSVDAKPTSKRRVVADD
jgi:glycosyltransferase involved in cell wall biosynthesis